MAGYEVSCSVSADHPLSLLVEGINFSWGEENKNSKIQVVIPKTFDFKMHFVRL